MTLAPALLALEHIRQVYGTNRQRIVALEDINFRMHEGEFVALLGPSGCGKSTLLRIITGLQRPTDGRVLYRGELGTSTARNSCSPPMSAEEADGDGAASPGIDAPDVAGGYRSLACSADNSAARLHRQPSVLAQSDLDGVRSIRDNTRKHHPVPPRKLQR